MQGRQIRPPRIAAALLRLLLPSSLVGDSILGDFWQEYHQQAITGSRAKARLWYWRQALGLGRRLAWARLIPTRSRPGESARLETDGSPGAGEPGGHGSAGQPRRGPAPHERRKLALFLDNVLQDLRFATRQVTARPAFTLLVVLTLAVAIGPNVAIFSTFKAVVLEPLPYPEPERLVHIWETDVGGRWRSGLTAPNYWDYRDGNTAFEEIGVYNPYVFNIGDGEPARVSGVLCSASLLRALGVEPAIGRLFTDQEELDGSGRVVVISNALWQERYDSDPDVVGEQITVNGEAHEVVGVMPDDFEFLSVWSRGSRFQLWTPYPLQGHPGTLARDNVRGGHWLLSVGRLRPEADWRAAEQELRGIASRLAEEFPDTNARNQVWLQPFVLEVFGSAAGRLMLLGCTVGMVLLVACANVASMLLAKGAGRQAEVGIRVALGSARWRMVSQLLTESLLLSLLAGLAGLGLAVWSLDALRGLMPPELPRAANITIDGPVLLFVLILSVLTALIFGLAPARHAARTDIVDALKESGGGQGGMKKRSRTLRRLAIAQLAVALLMTNGAVFLFKSLQNVLTAPQAFDTEQVLTAHIMLAGGEYQIEDSREAFWEQLVERVEALPDVERAAVTAQLPLETGTVEYYLLDGERYDPEALQRTAWRNFISPGYFEAMGIPLLAGRGLSERDAAPISITEWSADNPTQEWGVVINRSLAEEHWPEANPLGKRLHNIGTPRAWTAVVVGVVEGVRQAGPERRSDPAIYWLYEANPFAGANLVVRARVDPLTLITAVQDELERIDADLPLSDIRTMATVLDSATRGRYFITLLTGLFTAIAVVLAVAGTYGILSYYVAQRTHEIGVRVALGASRRRLIMMVFRQVFVMLAFGVGIGLVLIINFNFVARRLVWGLSPLNPFYISIGVLFVVVVALVATLRPALRATRVDPVVALRAE